MDVLARCSTAGEASRQQTCEVSTGSSYIASADAQSRVGDGYVTSPSVSGGPGPQPRHDSRPFLVWQKLRPRLRAGRSGPRCRAALLRSGNIRFPSRPLARARSARAPFEARVQRRSSPGPPERRHAQSQSALLCRPSASPADCGNLGVALAIAFVSLTVETQHDALCSTRPAASCRKRPRTGDGAVGSSWSRWRSPHAERSCRSFREP